MRDEEEWGDPLPLAENAGIAYQGSNVLGAGFFVDAVERNDLLVKDARNEEIVWPVVNGEELNSNPALGFGRYVVNFGDRDLEAAGDWPQLLDLLRKRVKPQRDRDKEKRARTYW